MLSGLHDFIVSFTMILVSVIWDNIIIISNIFLWH